MNQPMIFTSYHLFPNLCTSRLEAEEGTIPKKNLTIKTPIMETNQVFILFLRNSLQSTYVVSKVMTQRPFCDSQKKGKGAYSNDHEDRGNEAHHDNCSPGKTSQAKPHPLRIGRLRTFAMFPYSWDATQGVASPGAPLPFAFCLGAGLQGAAPRGVASCCFAAAKPFWQTVPTRLCFVCWSKGKQRESFPEYGSETRLGTGKNERQPKK